ncbi:unannotated protein [freshwater metagenome]|uniref:Unannotated protein n=1 Tax=freshwater metagenome TaxID=449393 RepID=A0A6J6H0Y8_9ZZZZ
MEHGSELEGGLEVTEPAFGFEQVLVAERDIFRGQVRVRGRQQILAVELGFGGDLRPVDHQPTGRGLAQPTTQRRVVTQRALGAPMCFITGSPSALRLLGLAFAALADAFELGLDPLERSVALRGVAFGFERVVAHDPPLPGVVVEANFLHSEVVAHGLIATLPRHCGLGVRGAVAHLLPGDPVPAGASQVVQVFVGGEPAVDHRDDTAEPPAAQAVFHLGQDAVVVGVARPHPTANRDPLTRHGETDHDLREIRTRVLRLAVPAELVRVLGLEVGRGRVEEQQIDLQVEEIGDGEEHRLLHLGLRISGDQQIHRPIRLILIHRLQPRDRDVVRRPLRSGQLRRRADRPVRDQREQHPLHIGREPPATQHLRERSVDTELTPQAIEQPGDTHRPRRDDRQTVTDRNITAAVVLAEIAVDRPHQPAQPVTIEEVLTAEVQQHLRLRHPVHAAVVRELHVADDRPVTILPLRRPHVHAHTIAEQASQSNDCGQVVCPRFRARQTTRNPLTSMFARPTPLMCPSTAEPGEHTLCQ